MGVSAAVGFGECRRRPVASLTDAAHDSLWDTFIYIYIYIYICIYISYIYICTCVCTHKYLSIYEEGERKKREMERWREMERERDMCTYMSICKFTCKQIYVYVYIYTERESVERYSERAGEWESGGVVIETSPSYLSHHCPGAGDGDRNKPPA